MTVCFECGSPADHDHHVVHRSLGGMRTIPLCAPCHGKVHGRKILGAELTRAAMARLKASGAYTGGRAPYGWSAAPDGALVVDDGEQRAILAARDLKAAGLSLRAIGAELAARGLLPRSGGDWHAKTVRDLLAGRVAA